MEKAVRIGERTAEIRGLTCLLLLASLTRILQHAPVGIQQELLRNLVPLQSQVALCQEQVGGHELDAPAAVHLHGEAQRLQRAWNGQLVLAHHKVLLCLVLALRVENACQASSKAEQR